MRETTKDTNEEVRHADLQRVRKGVSRHSSAVRSVPDLLRVIAVDFRVCRGLPPREEGFILLTSLLFLLLIGTLLLLMHLQIAAGWRMSRDVEAGMRSLLLAQNGIEYGRALLPHLDIESLLAGPDGEPEGPGRPEWRNPMPLEEAGRIDPEQWRSEVDDGLPFWEGRLILPGGYAGSCGGRFFIRFSNNPEEPWDVDEDDVVILRSLGVAPMAGGFTRSLGLRNAVSLVEARLRQEKTFQPPAAVTLLGNEGRFSWEGNRFLIDGGELPGILAAGPRGTDSPATLTDSLSESQLERIRGEGTSPSVVDGTDLLSESARYRRLFKADFHESLKSKLKRWAARENGGIHYFQEGGIVAGPLQGFVAAGGELTLAAGAHVEGVLLHLGGGCLRILEGARVEGGVWVTPLVPEPWGLEFGSPCLTVEGDAFILYSQPVVQDALGLLPTVQKEWRILFPEMVL